MTELTEQQIEQAIAAFGNYAVAERMRRAAPFLQLPWDEPTEEEIDNAGRRGIESALREFVRRRNAALQPKPVDLRRPYCCFIGCQNPPTWQVDAHVGLEDDTQSCDDHLGHLLTDAPLHTVCPIRPVDPRREKIRNVLALGVDAGEPYITNATERILAVIDEV
jgi:hypothetical protein